MRKYLSIKNLPIILSFLVMLISLPVAVYLVQQKQELRERAAVPETASLTLETPQKSYQPGEVFKVDIKLDTGDRVIPTTGTDVILNYPSGLVDVLKIIPGNTYDTYPTQEVDIENETIKISGSAPNIASYFSGLGTFASIEFKAIRIGTAKINFVWREKATDDTNVVGLVDSQPQERLKTAPVSLPLVITELQPTPTLPPTLPPTPTPSPITSPTPTPSPIPPLVPPAIQASLFGDKNHNGFYDAEEGFLTGFYVTIWACKLDKYNYACDQAYDTRVAKTEGNAAIAFSSLPPGTYEVWIHTGLPQGWYSTIIRTTLGEREIKNAHLPLNQSPYPPRPSPPISPTPTPIGQVTGHVFEDTNYNHHEDEGEKRVQGMEVTLYKLYGLYDTMELFTQTITDINGVYRFTNLPQGKYDLTILKTPGYNYYTVVGGEQTFKISGGEKIAGAIFGLRPYAVLNLNLILEERGICGSIIDVSIYGSSSGDGLVAFGPLGKTRIDRAGKGSITLSQGYLGKTYWIFARTPSHLRKRSTSSITIHEGSNYVGFGSPIPGDLFIAPGEGEQDNVINNFDVAGLFQNWGPAGSATPSATPPAPTDFNCDGMVNTWDLKVVFDNFGKTGDGPTTAPPTPTPIPTLTPTPIPLPSVKLTANVPRGSKLSPGQSISFEGNFVMPGVGQPGCLSNNTAQAEVVFRGEIYDLISYPGGTGWSWWPIGEPKVLLGYLPCGSENRLNFILKVKTLPPEPPSPNVTALIVISAPSDLIKDEYPFSL